MATPTTFRADGWPLCPVCGQDELGETDSAEAVTLDDLPHVRLWCYWCVRYTVDKGECQKRAATQKDNNAKL